MRPMLALLLVAAVATTLFFLLGAADESGTRNITLIRTGL